MDKIVVDGNEFTGYSIATENAVVLMIKAEYGFLGCGYFSIAAADKLHEHVALVTGVKTFDDMLAAEVFAVSRLAGERGVRAGMTGREALALMVSVNE